MHPSSHLFDNFRKHYRLSICFLFFFLIACFFRLSELDWGFPYQHHPDEHSITTPAKVILFTGDLTPIYFNRPNHISIYLSSIAYWGYDLLFLDKTKKTLEKRYKVLPHLKLNRFLIAIQGVFISLVILYWGYVFVDIKFALLSTLVVSFLPLLMIHGHYATPDIPLSLYTLLVFLFASLWYRSNKYIYFLLMAFFHAWAILEKYPGLLAGFFPLIITFLKSDNWKKFLWLGIQYLFFLLLFMAISSPTFFFNLDKVHSALVLESRDTHFGVATKSFYQKFIYYYRIIYSQGGLILGLAAVSLLIKILYNTYQKGITTIGKRLKSSPTDLLLLVLFAFSMLFLLALCSLGLQWQRWIIPVIVPFTFIGCYCLYQWSFRGKYLLFSIIILHSLFVTFSNYVNAYKYENTINVMDRYIKENNINPDLIAADGYTNLKPGRPEFAFSTKFLKLKRSGKKYVLLSSVMYNRFKINPGHSLEKVYAAFLEKEPVFMVKATKKGVYKTKNTFIRYFYRNFLYHYDTLRLYFFEDKIPLHGDELRLIKL